MTSASPLEVPGERRERGTLTDPAQPLGLTGRASRADLGRSRADLGRSRDRADLASGRAVDLDARLAARLRKRGEQTAGSTHSLTNQLSLLPLGCISATSLLHLCYISAPSRRVRLEHAGDLEALCYLGGQRRRLPNVNLG